MEYETLHLEAADGIAVVTLDRPEVMNAWNDRMGAELGHAMAQCDVDDSIRVVVLTGAGRAFCAGADLSSGGDTFAPRDAPAKASSPRPRTLYPFQVRKPVIAALNGHAIGVGITYPMLCDIRLVAEEAKIQFAFVRRGVIPELASHVIVSRVAGLSNAADLLLSGRMLLGREAAALGLASAALPAADVLPAALERAQGFLDTAPASVAVSKRLLWEGLATGVPEMLRREMKLFAWAIRQPDAREGPLAFVEKRAPRWALRASRDLPDGIAWEEDP